MFGRNSQSADEDALKRITRRVEVLEARCQDLAQALEMRDAQLEKLRLDNVVLGKRLEEGRVQSRKAVNAVFDRFEALRAQLCRAPHPAADTNVAPRALP